MSSAVSVHHNLNEARQDRLEGLDEALLQGVGQFALLHEDIDLPPRLRLEQRQVLARRGVPTRQADA